ncbi:hypothetical protein NM208_g1926 [Fusarium decemcellulare]|uniref:Uncharacterized protein n=1 Tax=Fusarium decemcellulare TaxID=57161 RepID=A0ACC1SUH3_9HYPO|nr:hypothetical protein NM208_g1926 [Fusarium decemcellulare]
MTTAQSLDYFEVCWSIFSTICLVNVIFGVLICEITSFTVLAAVPIFSSAAGAIANGLCYYVYYQSHPLINNVVAAIFSDFFWLLQEASLLLYSYIILRRVLRSRQWRIFSTTFWLLIVATAITRVLIAIYRVKFLVEDVFKYQVIINYLHIGYFTFISISECLSACFLVNIFASAKNTSLNAALKVGLMRYMTRSTELRVAFLAFLGVTRTIIHPFQNPGQKAANVASQLDRFLYALFCLYPVVLYIDTLASKLKFTEQVQDRSTFSHGGGLNYTTGPGLNTQTRCFAARFDHIPKAPSTHIPADINNSTEQIVKPASIHSEAPEIDLEEIDINGFHIKKTTELTMIEDRV